MVGNPAPSSSRIVTQQVAGSSYQITASSNNQEVLNQFQLRMSEYLMAKGKGVSVNTLLNPMQPNL